VKFPSDVVLGVMFSVARSRFALPTQFVFLVVNAFGMLFGIIYGRKTPDLYANNAHSKTGWIITWIASAWVFMALVQAYTSRTKAHSMENSVAQPVSSAAMAQYQRVQDAQLPTFSRWSNDSGQGTERNSSSLCGHSRSPSVESENQPFNEPRSPYLHDDDEEAFEGDVEKRGFLRDTSVDRFLGRNISRIASFGQALKIMRLFYVIIDRTILIQGFVAFLSGTVVYGGIGVSTLEDSTRQQPANANFSMVVPSLTLWRTTSKEAFSSGMACSPSAVGWAHSRILVGRGT